MTLLLVLLLAVDAGAPAAPDPGAPTVSARADRASARIGDPIQVTVVAIRKSGMVVNLGQVTAFGRLAVLDRSEQDRDLGDGSARKEWLLRLQAFETGAVEVPPIPITYLTGKGEVREVQTAPLELQIEAMTTPADAEIKDAQGPVRVIADDYTALYIAGGWIGVGLLFGLVWLLRRAQRRREASIVAPPPPPHELALDLLRALGQSTDLALPDRKPFFLAMSEILRDFLRARLGIAALTTSELRDELGRRIDLDLDRQTYDRVIEWVEACDLVKFAQYPATREEAAAARDELEQILRTLAPPAPVAQAKAA